MQADRHLDADIAEGAVAVLQPSAQRARDRRELGVVDRGSGQGVRGIVQARKRGVGERDGDADPFRRSGGLRTVRSPRASSNRWCEHPEHEPGITRSGGPPLMGIRDGDGVLGTHRRREASTDHSHEGGTGTVDAFPLHPPRSTNHASRAYPTTAGQATSTRHVRNTRDQRRCRDGNRWARRCRRGVAVVYTKGAW